MGKLGHPQAHPVMPEIAEPVLAKLFPFDRGTAGFIFFGPAGRT